MHELCMHGYANYAHHAFTIKLMYREGDVSAEHSPMIISPESRSPTCPGSPNATLSSTRPSSGPDNLFAGCC